MKNFENNELQDSGNSSTAKLIETGTTIFKCFNWELYDDGTFVISQSETNPLEEIYFPGELNRIEDKIKHIVVKEGITTINTLNRLKIESIELPESVTQIVKEAFYNCKTLKSIKISDKLTKIGERAFSNTPWFNQQEDGEVYINNILYTYKGQMPKNYHLSIKYGTKVINASAFKDCKNIESVYIPDTVTEVGECAFSGCTNLKTINIPQGIIKIREDTFNDCKNLKNVVIPNRVKEIGEHAFGNCTALSSIKISSSVEKIGSFAFMDCNALSSINIPKEVTCIGKNAFLNTSWYNQLKEGDVYINNIYYAYKGKMPKNHHVSIKDGTIAINENAFKNCANLKSIDIPVSVKKIGKWAFEHCSTLESINIPNSVTEIGECAFDDTPWFDKLEKGDIYINNIYYTYKGSMPMDYHLEIKKGTKTISPCAFISHTTLKTIRIPDTVTKIGSRAFHECSGIESIKLPNSVTEIDDCAFENCDNIETFHIPMNVTAIGDFAFRGCRNLKKIYVENYVAKIGRDIFKHSSKIQTIYVLDEKTYNKFINDERWAKYKGIFKIQHEK